MHRGETDAGGAADLQTDIMRFMAILALCLVAIFALVQSIPLIPEAPAESTASAAPPPPVEETRPEPAPAPATEPLEAPAEEPVRLTRPKWNSTFVARQPPELPAAEASPSPTPEPAPVTETAVTPAPPTTTPPKPESRGFTLRFESDHALTRLVATGKVGLYAIGDGRSQRMTVSESRISFWDASTPNAFHEMEDSTVPRPVVDALGRSGVNTASIDWGVTLPGKLKQQLDTLMRQHTGGALVIGLDGNLRLEPS
jgi:hypothetical protein